MKNEVVPLEDLICEHYFPDLTPFQRTFIKEVIYFIKTKGEHCLYKKYTERKYEEFINYNQMYLEIDDLVERKFLYEGKKTNKINDSFYVIKTYTVNEKGIRAYVKKFDDKITNEVLISEEEKSLSKKIQECVKSEDYELAALWQDILNKLKESRTWEEFLNKKRIIEYEAGNK